MSELVRLDVPTCVGAAYEQVVRGQPAIYVQATGAFWSIPLTDSTRWIVLFFACREKDGNKKYDRQARWMWKNLRQLKPLDVDFEAEAAQLLSDTMLEFSYGRPAFDRTQMKAFDVQVQEAANRLTDALIRHPDYTLLESSAINWPDESVMRMADMLRDLPYPEDWNAICDLDKPRPPRSEMLNWLVIHNLPNVVEMLEVLSARAHLSTEGRLSTKKKKVASGAGADALFRDALLTKFIDRNPYITPGKVSGIITPIVDRIEGRQTPAGKTAPYATCKAAAQEIKKARRQT